MTEKMKSGLETITTKFDGRIWKGVLKSYNGIFTLYVQGNLKLRKTSKYKFKIIHHAGFYNEKMSDYKDKCGRYFVVEKEAWLL